MMRRAARCVAGATAACAALTYAQACALHAAYSPLPGATDAPTEGIARGGDARRERRSTGGGGGGGDRTAGGGARRRWDDLERGSIRDRRRDARRAATATTTRRRETRRVIVLGDSLVTGVGCSVASAARGPVLPRIIAERLASLLGVDVEVRAFIISHCTGPHTVRPRRRRERRSLRTDFISRRVSPPTTPRFQSRHAYATPFNSTPDAFQLHPDVRRFARAVDPGVGRAGRRRRRRRHHPPGGAAGAGAEGDAAAAAVEFEFERDR
jgi:hypothetical protein